MTTAPDWFADGQLSLARQRMEQAYAVLARLQDEIPPGLAADRLQAAHEEAYSAERVLCERFMELLEGMSLHDRVIDYFRYIVPAGKFRAVRHIEEDLRLPYKTLGNLLNQMSAGEDSELVTAPGPYTGKLEAHRPVYKCYALRA